jgi:hypothetical protein
MIAEFFSLDVAPPAVVGAIGLTAGVVFFFILAAVAYVIFRILRKSVRMAFRMAIVAAILVIALVGTISFYWFGTGSSPRPTQKSSQRR